MHAGRVPPVGVSAEARVWYNPDMVSRNFIVPGLIAVIMMIITGNLSSLTIAREWENGTMEQLLSTPVRPSELALGKLAAYFLVGLIDMVICMFVGVFLFDVPFKGSLLFLTISSFVFLFGSLCTGIWVSATFRTQLMAYQMGTLISFLPGFLLSGFIYSISSMPRVIQAIALFVPARYFINISKGVFLKGIGPGDPVAGFSAAVRLRGADIFLHGPQTAAEGGLSHAPASPLHYSQGIHSGAARSAHAQHAADPAAAAVADFRLRGEPGRRYRQYRLDGSGQHARRAAICGPRLKALDTSRLRRLPAMSTRCNRCSIAGRWMA